LLGEKKPIIICRCNDVTIEDIINAVETGIDHFEVLRKYLKIGFGPCQGRSCLLLAARIFAKLTGRRIEEVISEYRVRPPIVPIPARVLLAGVIE
jgi:bacterioferritin-associated ferredoxin